MFDKTSWKDLLAKARKGDAIAQNEVGDHFSFGCKTSSNEILVRQSFTSAFAWYEKAANQDEVNALANLADFLSEGKGVREKSK